MNFHQFTLHQIIKEQEYVSVENIPKHEELKR